MGDISLDMNTPLDLTGFVSKHSPQPVDLTISSTKNNLSDYTVDLTFSPPPPSPENLTYDLEDLTYDENIPTDEEVDRYLKKMRQGVTFPFHFLEHIKEEEVTLLPPEIDGSKKYRLKATISNFTDLVKDRRWFRLSKSTVSDPKTVHRVARCDGSFVCNNLNCSFVSTQGEKNTSKFIFFKWCESLPLLWPLCNSHTLLCQEINRVKGRRRLCLCGSLREAHLQTQIRQEKV